MVVSWKDSTIVSAGIDIFWAYAEHVNRTKNNNICFKYKIGIFLSAFSYIFLVCVSDTAALNI